MESWYGQLFERGLKPSLRCTLLGVVLVSFCVPLSCKQPEAPTTKGLNVLLISIDTLRADRLGCYGYQWPTSPNLDRLAAEGVRFAQAIAQAPWTTPSHMSMLTSLYPSTHGVNRGWAEFSKFNSDSGPYPTLPTKFTTIAEQLKKAGYRTYALTGGGTLAGKLGFARGFDRYVEGDVNITQEVRETLFDWLQPGKSPFFVFFQTFEVHAPYDHLDFAERVMSQEQVHSLEEFLSQSNPHSISALQRFLKRTQMFRVDITSALYDGGIKFTDEFIGELIEKLKSEGLYDQTLIIVTSDHGEEFADHYQNRFYDAHCDTVYEELVHVPLIVHLPSGYVGRRIPRGSDSPKSSAVVDDQVEVIDIGPTILAALGLALPSSMQGRSLLPALKGEELPPKNWAIAEATCMDTEMKTLRKYPHKYVVSYTPPKGVRSGLPEVTLSERVFDLSADPRELARRDSVSVGERTAMRNELRNRLMALGLSSAGDGEGVRLTDDMRDRLQELGYLE